MMQQQQTTNNNSLYHGNWNMSDWNGVGAVDLNTFPPQQHQSQSNSSLSPSDYFTNGQVPVLNATSTGGASWKLLQDFQPAAASNNNMTDAFLLLDDAKLQLLDLDHHVTAHEPKLVIPVENIKQEEVDPWTEHVNYATEHNHTYAAPVAGRRARSREVS